MSVSMVASPWRRFVQAARWNGHAAHTTTGAASASEIHCQYRNCRGSTMASAITGTASATATSRRSRRARSGSGGSASAGACWGTFAV
jgi:hypothetical protein